MEIHEYTFDAKLFALIRVQAKNKKIASMIVQKFLNDAELNRGTENADLIETSLSLDEEETCELIEIDGDLTD